MADYSALNSLLGEHAIPEKQEVSTESSSSLHDLLGEYGTEATKNLSTSTSNQNPFVATAKSTAASMANAFAGQPLEDIGETVGSETLQKAGKDVRGYAEKIQKANPSQINSLSDIVEKPGTAFQTALGNVLPQLPVSMAGSYAGARAGAALPLPLPLKGVAAGVGGILGAFAPNYLQEAAEMRGKQHESGQEDKTKAYLTAVPAAGLETASDVLLAGKFLPDAVKKTAIGKTLGAIGGDELSATGSRLAHVGKQAAKGVAGEAGTEYAQTALEQYAGNQDLSTEEAQAEREVSAALGAIGGGTVAGGLSTFDSRAPVTPDATEEVPVVATETPAATTPIVPVTEPTAPPIVESDSPINVDAKLKNYVDSYDKKLKDFPEWIPTKSNGLVKAATAAGVYDENDDPATTYGKLRDIVYPPTETEIASRKAEAVKAQQLTELNKAPDGPLVGVAKQLVTDEQTPGSKIEYHLPEVSVEETTDATPEMEIDPETGEILTELDDGTPMGAATLEQLINFQGSKLLSKGKQAALDAMITTKKDERARAQIAEAERTLAEQLNGVPTDALTQQETTPLTRPTETPDGKSQNQAAQTTSQEVDEAIHPLHPVLDAAKEETAKLADTLTANNVPPETVAAIVEKQERRAVAQRELDPTIGFEASKYFKPAMERVIKHVSETGEPAFFIDGDLANLGGLNSHFGNNTAKANVIYKGITDIFRDELNKTGSSAMFLKHGGGDEFGSVVFGTNAEELSSALARASAKIKSFIAEQGLSDITHPKYKSGVNEFGASMKGTGLHAGFTQIVPGMSLAEVRDAASFDLDNSKKGIGHVRRESDETVGSGSPTPGGTTESISREETPTGSEDTGAAVQVGQGTSENARKRLISASPNGNLNAFSGKENAGNRAALIEALTGEKVTKSKATNTLLRELFYDAAGVDRTQVPAAQEKQFAAWARQSEVAPVDEAAAQTEANKTDVSAEQEQNGDYQKVALVLSGIPISIENSGVSKYLPEGSVREGVGADGKPWRVQLKDHYGEIQGTNGADGENVDVFIKPGTDKIGKVFIIDQWKVGADGEPTGEFDEHKIVFGASSPKEAADIYNRNYSPEWKGLGPITAIKLQDFKENWLTSDERMRNPSSKTTAAIDKAAKQKAKQEGVVEVKTKKPNSQKPPTGFEELKVAIGKLGGLKRQQADAEGFKDSKGRDFQYIFNKSDVAKTFDEMAGLLHGIGFEISGGNDLVEKLDASLRGTDFFTPHGAERDAELKGLGKSDDELRFESDLAVIKSRAKENLAPDAAAAWVNLVDSGEITPDNIKEFESDLDDDIEAEAKKPAVTSLFDESPAELDKLSSKQQLADIAAKKDKARNGGGQQAEPAPLFSDNEFLAGQTDITDLPESTPETKGKPVADDFLKAMKDFDLQQRKKYRLVESDAKPTIGKGGRMHAPHNGYEWGDGNVYAGGQWLPESEDSIRGGNPSKATIEATPEVADYLVEQAKDLGQVRVSLGKIYEKNGENRRLVYIEGGKQLTNAITNMAPSRNKVLMSEADAEAKGLKLGKTWKYSYKKHFNEEVKVGMHLGSDKTLDKQIVGYYYPDAVIRDMPTEKASSQPEVTELEDFVPDDDYDESIPFSSKPSEVEQPENKDLGVVKAKFADAVQKAYEEGELEIPQYMVALDILASDDPTVLQDIQRFVDKAFPSYGELQRVKAKGSVNMKRLLSLVGSSMYKANLADTSIKEMVQNSFDAVKAQVSKNKGLKGKGNIDILVDHSNRLIAIRDNGKGMSKSTILNAFLTVAGSNKEDLEGGLASGGFGMAKAAFLYGNERIYLRTVHNGKLSILEASGDELLSEKGGAEIEITDTDESNGTTLIVKVPEQVIIDGESRHVYFPYGYESIDFLRKPLLNDDVAINYRDGYIDTKSLMSPSHESGEDFDSSMVGANVVPTGRNMDLSGYDKNTTAIFDWGSADIYIGKKRNKYPKHQILSAGVYQFDDSFNLHGWEKVPYELIINVKPTVDADSASYPFNLKREGWKDLVEKDIEALKEYVKKVAMGIEAQETVDVFKNIKSLPKIEVANIGKSTGFDVSDFIPKKEVTSESVGAATTFVPPSITVSVGKVTGIDSKGETVTYVDIEKEKQKEKGNGSSFSTEKEAPKASDFLADFGIDASAPVYVNNTNYDYIEADPNISVFFAELGNIMMQVKNKVLGMSMYGYKKLKDTDTFMGVSIDKQYHGVHVNVPFHGIFLNPLAVKGTKLPGITQGLWETIVHEFTHIPEGSHDVGFVTEYHELSSKLASDGFDIQMRVLLGRVLNKHKSSFLNAREQYESSTTKNIAKSLHEGENGTGVASPTTKARPERSVNRPAADAGRTVSKERKGDSSSRFSRNAELRESGATNLADLFKSLGKFDKAPADINHSEAERIRYVQDHFLDLLSDLETSGKVDIKC